MAGDGDWRAFTGAPQPVEIHHRGIWYSGELLGWRHEADGSAVARVRCVVDRLRHSAWKDLSDLRLPDPANPPRRAVPDPALPATTAPEQADATRPHVLLVDLRTRPRSPEHVRTPPPGRRGQSEPPLWQPTERNTTPGSVQRAEHLERRRAHLPV